MKVDVGLSGQNFKSRSFDITTASDSLMKSEYKNDFKGEYYGEQSINGDNQTKNESIWRVFHRNVFFASYASFV